MLPISIAADFCLCTEGYFNVSQNLCLFLQQVKGNIAEILDKLRITQENQR